ncbi:hypothetical protein FRB95_013542 [Tulasnella sp. JGI-2019a]|nr:hypothetical protein FRB95_013542 [Tulasnella sp. JGI-2019a]
MMQEDSRFLEKVSPQIRRWERATLICSSRTIRQLNEPETIAPELRARTIGLQHNSMAETVTLDLRRRMVSQLENLTLASIALRPWDNMILSHLQVFALYRVCILPQELMLALRECRALVRLSMDQLTLSDGTASLSLPSDSQPIFLSSLVDLCIKGIPSDMIVALLAVLETPTYTSPSSVRLTIASRTRIPRRASTISYQPSDERLHPQPTSNSSTTALDRSYASNAMIGRGSSNS